MNRTEELERRVAELQTAVKKEKESRLALEKQTRERDLDAALRTEISRHNLGSDDTRARAQSDLFTILRGQVEHAEDGNIVAGADGAGLRDFVKKEIARRPIFAAPQQRSREKTGFDIENIRPFMSKSEKDQAWASIEAAERDWRNGA